MKNSAGLENESFDIVINGGCWRILNSTPLRAQTTIIATMLSERRAPIGRWSRWTKRRHFFADK